MKLKICRQEFLEKKQTKEPFLIKNAFEPDLNQEEVDEIISRCDISSQDFKLNYGGKVLDKNEYIEKYEDIGKTRFRFLRDKLYFYLRDGATLIANKISNEPKIYKYRRCIEHLSGRPTIASLYLAYGKDSSFRAHWDTRDVFALQFEGRKKWTLYKPNFELPINNQESKDMGSYTCPNDPYMEVVLEKGDLLYIPRGWWHDPRPLGEKSLHISIGTYPFYPRDYLSWLFNIVPNHEITIRKDILSFEKSKENFNELSVVLQKYLTDEGLFNIFRAQMQDKVYRTESPLNLELLASPDSDKSIHDEAILDINIINNVDLCDEFLVINGIKLNVSSESREIINYLIGNPLVKFKQVKSYFKNIPESKLNDFIFNLCVSDIVALY